MTVRPTLDSDSFEETLASAFVVQQDLMDVPLPAAILMVRDLVTAGQLNANGVMHLIAGRARNTANATGAAIGLLKGEQLVYCAGSGSAATYVGRRVSATLSISAKTGPRGEILRVEDAETDRGIGGAICHQFGAKSLLILPIYHGQALGGVLQVFFDEPHAFQDAEVSAYQSMANVIGEVTAQATKAAPNDHAALPKESAALWPSPMPTIEEFEAPMRVFPSNSRLPAKSVAISKAAETVIAASEKWPSGNTRPATAMILLRGNRVPLHLRILHIPIRKFADRTAVAVVLVVASLIAYTYRRPLPPVSTAEPEKSNTVEQQVSLPRTDPGSETKGILTPQTASVPMKDVGKAPGSTPRRVRVGDYEIDYLSEDVTVRHFAPKRAVQQAPLAGYRVEYLSDDVTVRHFAPKLAAVPSKQPLDHGTVLTPR
jgi:hypothetical protein